MSNYVILIILLLFYISAELATIKVYKISFIRGFLIKRKALPNIYKIIPKGWKISDIGPVERCTDTLRIYIKINNYKIDEWTNDNIIIDKKGNIIKERLSYTSKLYEEKYRRNNK